MTSIRTPYAVPTTAPGQVQTQTTMLTGNQNQNQQQPQTTITVPKAPAVPKTLGAFGTTTENTRWNDNIQQAKQGPAPSGFSKTAANPQLATWAYDVTKSLKPGQHGYQQAGTSNNWSAFNQGLAQAAPQQMQQQSAPAGVQPQQPTQANIPGVASNGLQPVQRFVPGRGPGFGPGGFPLGVDPPVLAPRSPTPVEPPQSGASSAVGSMLQQIAGPGYGGYQGGPNDMGAAQRMSQGISGPEFGGYRAGPDMSPAQARMNQGVAAPEYAGYQGGPDARGAFAKLGTDISNPEYAGYRAGPDMSPAQARMNQGIAAPEYAGYQGGPDDRGAFAKLGADIQNPDYAGYQGGPSDQGAAQKLMGGIAAGPDSGYREQDRTSEIVGATSRQYDQYGNPLNDAAQNKILANMDRQVQEGFGSDYLQQLSAAGMDPLKEAYDLALKKSNADMNRAGLAGSGFELEAGYGSQPESITSRFLKEAGNVARDVGLRGAEAEREDRFRNASLQDAAVGQGMGLYGQQTDDQFRRQTTAGAQDLQRVNLLQGQDAQNEQARQTWGNQALQRDMANMGFTSDAARLEYDKFKLGEDARRGWTDQDVSVQTANKDLAERNARLSSDLYQIGDQARQGWADRDVDVQGKNIDFANQGARLGLEGYQADDQARRGWTDQDVSVQTANKDLAERNARLSSDLYQTGEQNRQGWADRDVDVQGKNIDFANQGARLGLEGYQADDQARRGWTDQDVSVQTANKDLAERNARLSSDLYQIGDQARQGWADRDVDVQGKNIDFANQGARLGLEGFQVDDQSRQGWYDRDTDTQGKNLDFANQGARLNADLYQIGDQAKKDWYDRDVSLQQANKDNLARGFDMANTMDQADFEQKRYWNEDDLARQKFDKENLSRGFDMANTLQGREDQQDQYWNEDQFTRDNTANQRLMDSTKLGMDYDQTNEANSQWNRNFLQGQAQQDFQNAADLWNKQADYGYRDADRIDKARQFDISHGFEVDRLNQEVNQQGYQNLLQFYGLQGAAANDMQNSFWGAAKNSGQGLVNDGLDRSAVGGWIGDLFNFGRQDPVAKPPAESASKVAFGPMDPALSDPTVTPLVAGPMANRRYMPTRQY